MSIRRIDLGLVRGASGQDGENATINGVSTIVIQGGANISVTQNGDTLVLGLTGTTPTQKGGTGNSDGYIRTGHHSNAEAGEGATVEGYENAGFGDYSHTEGRGNTTYNPYSHVLGKWGKPVQNETTDSNQEGDGIVLGNGIRDPWAQGTQLSNAFRVTFGGEVYGLAAYNATGADYAEHFEWLDGNPEEDDRVGYFVTLDGELIRLAEPGEYVLGIVSGQPCIIGNSDEDWQGRWLHDPFGRFVREKLPDGGWRYKPNPEYDPSKPYVPRKNRPEWDASGMLGVLSVWDDGSCQVNGYCRVGHGGIATAAESHVYGETWRVIKRVTSNIIKIVFR